MQYQSVAPTNNNNEGFDYTDQLLNVEDSNEKREHLDSAEEHDALPKEEIN